MNLCSFKVVTVLDNSNAFIFSLISILGDSQARNLFTSFILMLTENYKDGIIADEFKSIKEIQQNCTGSYQILNNNCRQYFIRTSKSIPGFCGKDSSSSSFEILYYPHFDTFISKTVEKDLEKLHDGANTYIVIGSGTHFNSDYRSYIQYFFEYMVKLKNKRQWPHYIVETLHDVLSPESTAKRRRFNDMVARKANQLGVDVFDNTQLSIGLETFDGRRYGMAFHSLKARILMHYFYNKLEC